MAVRNTACRNAHDKRSLWPSNGAGETCIPSVVVQVPRNLPYRTFILIGTIFKMTWHAFGAVAATIAVAGCRTSTPCRMSSRVQGVYMLTAANIQKNNQFYMKLRRSERRQTAAKTGIMAPFFYSLRGITKVAANIKTR